MNSFATPMKHGIVSHAKADGFSPSFEQSTRLDAVDKLHNIDIHHF